jgi:hypothetical protein
MASGLRLRLRWMGMWCGGTRGWLVGLVCWTGDCVGVSLGGCGVRLVVWYCSDLIDFVVELGSVSSLSVDKCVVCNLLFLFSCFSSPVSLLLFLFSCFSFLFSCFSSPSRLSPLPLHPISHTPHELPSSSLDYSSPYLSQHGSFSARIYTRRMLPRRVRCLCG